MPCYDPPMPWEGAEKANAIAAVKILCEMCRTMLAEGIPPETPRQTLVWFLEHRKVDLERALAFRNGAEAEDARTDIAAIERILQRE